MNCKSLRLSKMVPMKKWAKMAKNGVFLPKKSDKNNFDQNFVISIGKSVKKYTNCNLIGFTIFSGFLNFQGLVISRTGALYRILHIICAPRTARCVNSIRTIREELPASFTPCSVSCSPTSWHCETWRAGMGCS